MGLRDRDGWVPSDGQGVLWQAPQTNVKTASVAPVETVVNADATATTTASAGGVAAVVDAGRLGVRVAGGVWGRVLPFFDAGFGTGVWVVGAHGGAGESSLAGLDDRWAASGHRWPQSSSGEWCVVCARSNAAGIRSAREVIASWAAGGAGSVRLAGLCWVADAPGRLPRVLRSELEVVSGGVPNSWFLPWCESWRLGGQVLADSRVLRGFVDEVWGFVEASKGK